MDKKKDLINSLGLDVELKTENLEHDGWAAKMLKEIGSTIQVEGHEHVGSIAIHLYVEKDASLKGKYSMASITQVSLDDVSEQLALLGFNNAVIEVRKYYGRGHKTTRKGDKR